MSAMLHEFLLAQSVPIHLFGRSKQKQMGQRENLRITQQQTAPLFPTMCLPRGSEAFSFSSLPTSLLGTAHKSWPINYLQVFRVLLCFCSHILLSLPVIFTTSFCFLEHQFQEKNLAAPCLQSSNQTSTVGYCLKRAHYLRLSLSCPEKPTENGRQMGSKVQRTPRALTKRGPRRINARAKTIGTNINKCGSHLGKRESVSPGRHLTFFRNQSCRAQRFTTIHCIRPGTLKTCAPSAEQRHSFFRWLQTFRPTAFLQAHLRKKGIQTADRAKQKPKHTSVPTTQRLKYQTTPTGEQEARQLGQSEAD